MPHARCLRTRSPVIPLLLLGPAAIGLGAEPPGPARAQERPPSVSDDEVVQPASGRLAEAEQAAELKLRYATARVRLAELDLQRALAANQAVRGAIGDREIERLKHHVELTRRQHAIVLESPRTAARLATEAAAEAAIAEARGDLAAALGANHRVPGSVSDLNVQRLQTRLELAEIRVAICRNPASELSLLDEMQWTIDQLTDEVIDLRHRVETGGAGD